MPAGSRRCPASTTGASEKGTLMRDDFDKEKVELQQRMNTLFSNFYRAGLDTPGTGMTGYTDQPAASAKRDAGAGGKHEHKD